MTNNLLNLKKDLKSFAKKCKDFKYTDSALLTFLLNGMLISTGEMFAETVTKSQINNQVSQINTSINQMRTDFKHARAENNKLIRDTNLELTQLMEQGDHVTKSPWSSWQFGINDFYNDWHGTYKGKGDKKASYVFERDKSLVNRSSYPGRIETKYGATTLGLVREPNAAMDVSAGLTPKSVNKIAPKFTVQGAGGGLPPFEPKVISPPNAPQQPSPVNITLTTPTQIKFNAFGVTEYPGYTSTSSGLWLNNYETVNTTGAKIKIDDTSIRLISGSVNYQGNAVASAGGTLNAGDFTTSSSTSTWGTFGPRAFISTTSYSNGYANNNVNVTGNYDVELNSGLVAPYYFMGLNTCWYLAGGIVNYTGTLNLNNQSAVDTGVLVGLRLQTNGRDQQSAGATLKNSGTVNLYGKRTIGEIVSTETAQETARTILDNSGGIINVYGAENIGIDFGMYDGFYPYVDVKGGIINVYGDKSYGLRVQNMALLSNRPSNGTPGHDDYYKEVTIDSGKIKLTGNESIGLAFSQAVGTSSTNVVDKVTNMEVEVGGTKNIGILRASDFNDNLNNSADMIVDNNFISNNKLIFLSDASDGVLLRTDKYKIILDKDITTDSGSTRNTMLLANKDINATSATVQFGTSTNSPTLTVTGGGTEFRGLIANAGGKAINYGTLNIGTAGAGINNSRGIVIKGNTSSGENYKNLTIYGNNLIGLYNEGTFDNKNGDIILSGDNQVGIYNNAGTVTLGTAGGSESTTISSTSGTGLNGSGIYTVGGTVTSHMGNNLKIITDDTGKTVKGAGLYASNGANVNVEGAKISVKNGQSGVVSDNSAVDLKNGTVSYNGEGYAVYTKGTGTIDLTSGTLNLDGKAIGLGIDLRTTPSITTNSTTINVLSNDVTVAYITNAMSKTLNVSNIDGSGFGSFGDLFNATVTPAAGISDYRRGMIDGLGHYQIDVDIDKKAVADGTAPSYVKAFVSKLPVQRANVELQSGKTVNAYLTGAEANAIGESTVVGLAMSSSSYATSNNETQINLASGSTVNADRTDSGNGAIGLYTNFGKININNGTLNVETDTTNTVNDQAVGVYAVNGSEVNNNGGNINVGGKNSIGILGLAYREDSAGTVIGNEFGSANEGKATIKNNGNITMDGKEAKGVFIKNNGTSSVADNVANNLSNGVITMSGADSVGMYADKATLNNHGKIDLQAGTNGKIGMYGINGSDITNHSDGQIIVGDSTISAATDVPNIGMYTSESNLLKNYGTIDIKENSYGIYGENIQAFGTSKIKVGKNGVGIFAKGTSGTGTVTLDAGSEITTSASAKDKEAVGVFTAGTNPVNINDNGSKMDLKDWTFGYVIKAPGTLTTNGSSTVTLDNEAVYAYSDNDSSVINNYAPIKATGDRNYGIYSSGTVDNYGNMDLKSGNGVGNIGIYSTKGVATNWATIDTGKTNKTTKSYGIGMATGYYDGAVSRNQGTVINKGTINVTEDNSIGMYAVGAGSKAINDHGATINLSGKNTIGMYIDQGAEGENYGTIVGNGDSIKGVVAANQGKFKNYGTIQITGNRGIGIYTDKGVVSADGVDGPGASNTGSFKAVYESSPTDEKVEGGVTIKVPPKATPVTVTINGKAVEITGVDTNATPSSVNATEATVTSPSGVTVLDLAKSGFLNFESNPSATSIGMYVDTSGIKYTNPIQGLSNLAGLTDINMYFGTEAARYTNARAIELGDNIIKPYNDALATVVSTGTVLNTNSSSLTWLAIPTKSSVTGLYDKVYLVKVPYTDFVSAKDPNTYNFLDGLEQRYGVEGLGTREKELFNKLNDLGKGEQHIFTQAVDEMKGHQYANIQQRTNATGNALDKEFSYLRNEWRNPTKQNNKIKAFGLRDEYNTDTAGIIDYKSNAYGVAYVHEDEKIRMGNSSGWYAGAVTNRFRFKDLGKSKEDQTMVKLGVFKTMSPKGDHNGALQWTIGGDVFAGINNMKRKFWVVDDTFEAKSTYHTYGAALKNELGYDIRMSERTHLRPYGALKMEYGRFNDVKEDSGQMRLEVKGNDYFSVKPEAGLEFKYVQPLAVRTNLTVGLTAAYENELGKLQNGNQARVRYTTAGWYNLEKEKEDRRGNGKFDLNIGVDNTRFGVTVNAGYDTKGSNIRGGIGFRAIY